MLWARDGSQPLPELIGSPEGSAGSLGGGGALGMGQGTGPAPLAPLRSRGMWGEPRKPCPPPAMAVGQLQSPFAGLSFRGLPVPPWLSQCLHGLSHCPMALPIPLQHFQHPHSSSSAPMASPSAPMALPISMWLFQCTHSSPSVPIALPVPHGSPSAPRASQQSWLIREAVSVPS